jgi:hypothetical protein
MARIKVYYSNSIIITIVALEMFYLPTLALKSPNKTFYIALNEFIEHTFKFLVEAVLHIISFIIC